MQWIKIMLIWEFQTWRNFTVNKTKKDTFGIRIHTVQRLKYCDNNSKDKNIRLNNFCKNLEYFMALKGEEGAKSSQGVSFLFLFFFGKVKEIWGTMR